MDLEAAGRDAWRGGLGGCRARKEGREGRRGSGQKVGRSLVLGRADT